MDSKITICVCGGGSLGTVIAGVAAAAGHRVNILTGKPSRWGRTLTVTDPDGRIFDGPLNKVSDKPSDVIPTADMVFICLPGYAIHEELTRIKPYLSGQAIVGSVFCSTGFFIMAMDVLGDRIGLFGFQRVPFISRVAEYGHSANLLGYKKSLNVAFWNVPDEEYYVDMLSGLLLTPVSKFGHPLDVTLTNSNPILHPARLYSLFSGYDSSHPFLEPPLFYEDWTVESSEILIACDREFQTVVKALGIEEGIVPPLLEYYESKDAESLAAKLRSITAFKGIYAPTVRQEDGTFAPDYDNRYFSEDIPYGLMLIRYIAQLMAIKTPSVDRIIHWYESLSGKRLLDGDLIARNDATASIRCLNRDIIQRLIDSHHG